MELVKVIRMKFWVQATYMAAGKRSPFEWSLSIDSCAVLTFEWIDFVTATSPNLSGISLVN